MTKRDVTPEWFYQGSITIKGRPLYNPPEKAKEKTKT